MEWLQTPALAAGLGVLVIGLATLLLVASAVVLGAASVWMKPERSDRAHKVLQEWRRIVAALRGKPPPRQ